MFWYSAQLFVCPPDLYRDGGKSYCSSGSGRKDTATASREIPLFLVAGLRLLDVFTSVNSYPVFASLQP